MEIVGPIKRRNKIGRGGKRVVRSEDEIERAEYKRAPRPCRRRHSRSQLYTETSPTISFSLFPHVLPFQREISLIRSSIYPQFRHWIFTRKIHSIIFFSQNLRRSLKKKWTMHGKHCTILRIFAPVAPPGRAQYFIESKIKFALFFIQRNVATETEPAMIF